MKERIVGEVSKSWPSNSERDATVISQRFEQIIKANAQRGYELESWQMVVTSFVTDMNEGIVETIIAVFVKAEPQTTSDA